MSGDICVFCGQPIEQEGDEWVHVETYEAKCPESGWPAEPLR